MTNRNDIPTQEFNGKKYRLYPGEKYFSRGNKRLHVEVWKLYNGEIKPGFDIHHINGISTDNRIENLECIDTKKHRAEHQKERLLLNPDYKNVLMTKGCIASKEWHKSPDGIKWHREHAIKNNFGKCRDYGDRTCVVCLSEFKATYHSQKFCSNSCKSKFRRDSGKDLETRSCCVCGKDYMVDKYRKTKTCSLKCATIISNNTKKNK